MPARSGIYMTALLVGALGAVSPALAQKQGGTLTVGLEPDIPGFDPLKVGVYDTAANIAASDGKALRADLIAKLRAHRWDRVPTDWSQ